MRPTTRYRLAIAALTLALPSSGWAAGSEDLVATLSGPDEQARANARQLLPRQGVAVMPRLIPLLSSDRAPVREAAFQVLADLANEASAPGRERDRETATGHLLTLLASDRSPELKIRGLRLLPIAYPDVADVAPVAALLKDPRLRERAREALEEIGSPPSRSAIRDFLGQSDADFDVALLNSLARLRDRDGLKRIAALLDSGPPKVRIAAARALAWTGDPNYLHTAQGLVEASDPPLRAEAADALLRLIAATARRPEHRQAAIAAYRALLKSATGPVKDGALAGLGRLADPATVPDILAAIRDENPPTSTVGLEVLAVMPGAEVTGAILDAYAGSPGPVQRSLLSVLGARRDPRVLPVLEQHARSASGEERLLALQALANTGHDKALEFLAEEAKHGDEAFRAKVKAIRHQALQREKARLIERMQRNGGETELLGQLGVIGRWWVVGPFDLGEKDEGWKTRYIGEPKVSVVARYMAGKVRRQWKRVDSHDSQGRIDLRAAIAERDHCIGYAYAEIEVEKATDAVLLLGVDDSERVWVNGEQVFELFTRRGLQVDQDHIPVKLKAGVNTILLKVYQDSLGWEFCARLVTTGGQPVPLRQKAE